MKILYIPDISSKGLPGRMRTKCSGKLLRNCTLAHKEYKSLMSEGIRELRRTCPLCTLTGKTANRRIDGRRSFRTRDSHGLYWKKVIK